MPIRKFIRHLKNKIDNRFHPPDPNQPLMSDIFQGLEICSLILGELQPIYFESVNKALSAAILSEKLIWFISQLNLIIINTNKMFTNQIEQHFNTPISTIIDYDYCQVLIDSIRLDLISLQPKAESTMWDTIFNQLAGIEKEIR